MGPDAWLHVLEQILLHLFPAAFCLVKGTDLMCGAGRGGGLPTTEKPAPLLLTHVGARPHIEAFSVTASVLPLRFCIISKLKSVAKG